MNRNEIAVREEKKELSKVTKEELCNYLNTFGVASQLNAAETAQFVSIAMAFNLNPFRREIYAVPYETRVKHPNGQWGTERKLSVITGYEVYLKRAERLGVLDGWEVSIEGSGADMRAVLTVYRKDWGHPFKHEVFFDEVAKKNKETGAPMGMWKTMPKFMLKKVAVAQGFRLAFPDEFGGMPYTADELPDDMTKGFTNLADASKEGEAKEPEYIPPAKEEPKAQQDAAPASSPQASPGEALKEGDTIPGAYWKMNAAGKAIMIPAGHAARKVDGVWKCVRV